MHFKTKFLAIIVLVISTNSHAALVQRLNGLAYYDTEAGLTWLADAAYLTTQYVNSGGTEGDADGRTKWAFANAWAAGLNIAGVTDWRLPATFDIGNDGCNTSYSGTDCGFNVDPASGELANLFSNVLGIVPYKDTNGDVSANWKDIRDIDISPFYNIQSGYYWSSTTDITDSSLTWAFSTFSSNQLAASKTGSTLRAWAVKSGDVGVVPVPAAAWLFVSGLIGLVGISKRKKA